MMLAPLLDADGDGIVAVEAGAAVIGGRMGLDAAEHPFLREIGEAVKAEVGGDVLQRDIVGKQGAAFREINAEVAAEPVRRTTDPHVDFLGAGFAERMDAGTAGGAADDAVVDQADAFAADRLDDRLQLARNQFAPRGQPGIDERTADVVVAADVAGLSCRLYGSPLSEPGTL